ncbi:MAG: hypothetical protein E4H33_05270 [Anaerolineales bacterium]|nr:MAG: hypothetical protein E4H33_05270 [Anaerolineales bacterium]
MNNMSWIEIIYWGATIIGGTLFLLRTIMLMVGGGVDHTDFGGDFHGDVGVDLHPDTQFDADHTESIGDSDFSFKLLSLQGITAFFMMFGLIGLALLRARLPNILTIFGGSIAGLFAVWVISLLFSQMKRLQSDGTINIKNAIGQTGSVYLAIPAKGSGQVQVSIQGSLKILNAVAEGQKNITTGSTIEVTGTVDNQTVVVKKL